MKKKWIALMLLCSLCLTLGACTQGEKTENLMDDVTPKNPVFSDSSDIPSLYPMNEDVFVEGQRNFSVELFKKTVDVAEGENILISPLSVSLALSMAANGGVGETQSQMLQILSGGMSMDAWNQALYQYVTFLTASEFAKVEIANSVWFRNEKVFVKNEFLQKAADYYGASAYKTPFDSGTVKDINAWVKENTDGMIDQIIDKIDPDVMLYLINALVFEADWQNVYRKSQVADGIFTAADGSTKKAEMMHDTLYSYLETDGAVGFVKDYKGGDFRFVALLPEEGSAVEDFVATLTEDSLSEILENVINTKVITKMPKFSYEYSAEIKQILMSMGLTDAFDWNRSDFSAMGTMENGKNLFISNVLHKTYIEVGEKGTRAAAITALEAPGAGMPPPEEPKTVYLDRPFVFMIVDAEMNLPLFMGIVHSVE